MKTRILFCLLSILISFNASIAQTISGYVFDAVDGEPIMGAQIQCGSSICLTDMDGHFKVSASPGDKITVKYIGRSGDSSS